MNRITSFSVNHDYIMPGVYISRIDGDIVTYDLRTRRPNAGDYMDNITMHSVEHMLATFLRNSEMADQIIYFGPMGCQTGFYLLVRGQDHDRMLNVLRHTLRQTIEHQGGVFGASQQECGNYRSLDMETARKECERYLKTIENWSADQLNYPQENG